MEEILERRFLFSLLPIMPNSDTSSLADIVKPQKRLDETTMDSAKGLEYTCW